MKVGSLTTANAKGQVVIPKNIRETLGITSDITLNITMVGNGIYIYPVEAIVMKAEQESSYLELLKKTKGTWSDKTWNKQKRAKSKVERHASKDRKTAW